MTMGHTLLTLAAFMFLSTILLNFNRLMATSGDDLASGQDGILATTIATSYIELAQGMAFDEVTDSSDIAIDNPAALTNPSLLGPDASTEDSVFTFNDFDDFNGFTADKDAGGTNMRFRTSFRVSYVNAADIKTISSVRSFVKRMDLKTWRIFPPVSDVDTLEMSTVMGYFHFD